MNWLRRIIKQIRIKRLILGAILGVFLGIVFARIDGPVRVGNMIGFFSIVGFVGYSILLHVINRVGFWFCLVFAIEWALLPIVTGIVANQWSGSGLSGIGGGIGQGLLLALSIPVGIIGFITFIVLAFVKYRKRGVVKSAGLDIAEQIRELAKLKDEGILTQEEFESKKTDLLSHI